MNNVYVNPFCSRFDTNWIKYPYTSKDSLEQTQKAEKRKSAFGMGISAQDVVIKNTAEALLGIIILARWRIENRICDEIYG